MLLHSGLSAHGNTALPVPVAVAGCVGNRVDFVPYHFGWQGVYDGRICFDILIEHFIGIHFRAIGRKVKQLNLILLFSHEIFYTRRRWTGCPSTMRKTFLSVCFSSLLRNLSITSELNRSVNTMNRNVPLLLMLLIMLQPNLLPGPSTIGV